MNASKIEPYQKVVTKKLAFKGDRATPASDVSISVLGKRKTLAVTVPTALTVEANSFSQETHQVQVRSGTGRITSSGSTIHGHETLFMSQLSVNDAIIITHPTTLQEETKVVKMVLSNVSIGISSAFSSDLISTTPFRLPFSALTSFVWDEESFHRFIKAPKDSEDAEEKQRVEEEKSHRNEEAAFGTYASKGGTQFTYRVKKDGAYGGYKIMTEGTSSNLSREQLLDRRIKKKSDRHCN